MTATDSQWNVLPKDPPPSEPMRPWSAIVCIFYSAAAIVIIPAALLLGGISPRWGEPDPAEVWHSRSAIALVFSALMSEIFLLVSKSANVRILSRNETVGLRSYWLGDSVLTLSSYFTKGVCAGYVGLFNGGIMHMDVLAHGGARPVYLGRFIQWSIAVPLLIVLGNRSCMDKLTSSEKVTRCGPGVVTCFLYCWSAWVMEVTTAWPVRWFMCGFCFFGVLIVMVDQFVLLYQHRSDHLANYKAGLLLYSNIIFTAYGVVFMMGRFGTISSISEQLFYAYSDATLKVLQGSLLAMLRNRQDLDLIHMCWTAALAANQDLDNLIQRAKVPVFAMDLNCCITQWNGNLKSLTNLDFEDVKGKPLLDFVTADCRETLKTVLQRVLVQAKLEAGLEVGADSSASTESNTGLYNLVEFAMPVQGTELSVVRQLAVTLVPKSTQGGGLAGLMGIGQDLSEIAELKLVQDRKTALMAMLSHEIRSPLHGMSGLTAALLETEAGKPVSRQLNMIRNCSSRLLDLVTNVMDLAQHEKRKREGRPATQLMVPVDFVSIADEVVLMMRSAVDKLNKPLVRPTVQLVNAMEGKQVPLVLGNPHQCTQLVYNLMTNACKFTDKGSVTLGVEYDEKAHEIMVTVTDTGRGIAPESQARIFQPFQQEHNSGDARSFEGVGLGLAVCTEIVDSHGGKLRLESEVGKGSKFTIILPADGSLGWSKQVLSHEHACDNEEGGKGSDDGDGQDRACGLRVRRVAALAG